eukprot:m.52103 g.52103  ORF g.52103 m.52103 type:complete len:89 (-) comp48407_c0_seq9:236-502(-)
MMSGPASTLTRLFEFNYFNFLLFFLHCDLDAMNPGIDVPRSIENYIVFAFASLGDSELNKVPCRRRNSELANTRRPDFNSVFDGPPSA